MTCIVATVEDDTIWMGCDQLANYGYGALMLDTKIVKKDNIIMGFSGRLRDIQYLRFGFKIPKQKEGINDYEYIAVVFTKAVRKRLKECGASTVTNNEEESSAYILIGYKNKLYTMTADFCAARIEDNYFAIGSGRDVACGSLYSTEDQNLGSEARLQVALQAAKKHIISVGGSFIVESIKF